VPKVGMNETVLAIQLDPALVRYGGAKPPLCKSWGRGGELELPCCPISPPLLKA